jgi:hypothetical protein
MTNLPRTSLAPFALPPGMLMWASMYAVMFYVCGGMLAYMYDPE